MVLSIPLWCIVFLLRAIHNELLDMGVKQSYSSDGFTVLRLFAGFVSGSSPNAGAGAVGSKLS